MIKILPIFDKPQIKEVHTSAYIMSMLNTNTKFSEIWLLQNCIPLVLARKFDYCLTYDFKKLWFIIFFRSLILFHNGKKNISSKLKKLINKNFYIILYINEKYIPYRQAYQKYNHCHDLLIYGYDEEKYVFHTIAYNDKGLYEKCAYDMDIINTALRNHTDRFHMFYALHLNNRYNFTKKRRKTIKRQIYKFLKTSNSYKGYNSYIEFIKINKKSIEEKETLDMRCFRTILERSNIFSLFPKYFQLPEIIIENIIENKNIAEILFNFAIKYNITKEKVLYEKIQNYIDKYINCEKKIMSEVYDYL